jgi:hypothetical protein
MEKVDQSYLDELIKSQGPEGGGQSGKGKPEEHHMTYEEIQEMAVNLGKGDTKKDMDIIMNFLEVNFIFKCL